MNTNMEFTTIKLSPQKILRFNCKTMTIIKLIDGHAEIFGTELLTGRPLQLPSGYCGSIISFIGCTLQYTSSTLHVFTMLFEEDNALPNIYLNYHACLESLRINAKNDVRGPRIMICGQESVGKTTLCRTLANYATRKNRQVILIDTNVGLNELCVPGSIAATIVSKPYDIVDGWDIFEEPVMFSFGHSSPVQNIKLFALKLKNLSDLVNVRSENDPDVFFGGCIINTPGVSYSSQEKDLEAIQAVIRAFEVNVVVAIGDGLIESLIRKDLPNYTTLIKVPKSSGVHVRSPEDWDKARNASFSSYFHGKGSNKWQPHKITLSAEKYQIYKFECKETQASLLPAGENTENEWNQPRFVPFDKNLKNTVLAVSEATEVDEIADSAVYGFIVVLSVASDGSSITVLGPSDEEPPSNILLMTDQKYVDL